MHEAENHQAGQEASSQPPEVTPPVQAKSPLAVHMEGELKQRELRRELQLLDDLRVADAAGEVGRRGYFPSVDVNGEEINTVGPDGKLLGQGDYPKIEQQKGMQGARCRGVRADGMRCILWTVAPTDFCQIHGGLYLRAQLLAENRYARLLNGSRRLKDLFVDLCASPDLTDLRPILALQQTLLADTLDGLTGQDLGCLSPEAVSAITQLNITIAKLTETVVGIEAKAPTSVTAHQLLWLVEQIVTIVSNVVARALPGDELADVRTEIIEGIAFGMEEIAIANPRGGAPFPGFYDKSLVRTANTNR